MSPLRPPNAPLPLRALMLYRQASRQLPPVVRFPDMFSLLIHFLQVSNSQDHYILIQDDVDYAVITDSIFSKTSKRFLKGRE